MAEKEKAGSSAPVAPSTSVEMGDEEELFRRVLMIEDELRSIKAAMQAFPTALEKEKADIRKSLEVMEGLKKGLQDVSHTAEQSNKVVNHLERRVEIVKKDATSGFVVSTIIFSILMIISIFVRA
ncbi:MAG: hypothetical protein HQL84_10755 [Magnetococcales bacterium]|nr:hypothetical protein [Magnetococcales bacterium]MBF0150512.1 hypothetical protein [Magnetococcales bacterium]MBF0631403.1 hypothetical protein [Magnetococcales bacterium]